MPDAPNIWEFLLEAGGWLVWFLGFLGSYAIMAAMIFAGGWFIWRFINDVLFP